MKGIVYDNTVNDVETCDFVKCICCGHLQLVDLGEDVCPHCGYDGSFQSVFHEEPEINIHQAPELLGMQGYAVCFMDKDYAIKQRGQHPVTLRIESDLGYEMTFPTKEGAVIFAARNTLFYSQPDVCREDSVLKCMDASSSSTFGYHYVPRITVEEHLPGGRTITSHYGTTDQLVEALWDTLTDIPTDPETDCLDAPWYIFDKGTEREEGVWRWFDVHHSKGVGYLMNDYESE